MSGSNSRQETANPKFDSVETITTSNTSSAIESCLMSFASVKKEVLEEARMLEETYNLKRSEISNQGFCNLNFRMRHRNENNIQAEWYLSHFKNGRRTGTTNIKKNRGSHAYDVRLLKSSSPECMHSLVEATEIQARKIRKKIKTLSMIHALLTSLARDQNKNEDEPGPQNYEDSSFEEFMKNLF